MTCLVWLQRTQLSRKQSNHMWTRKLPPRPRPRYTGGALSIDLDSETLDIAGGTGIDTSGSGNTLTVAIDSTVAT